MAIQRLNYGDLKWRRTATSDRHAVRHSRQHGTMPRWRLIAYVLLPFAAAYFIAHVFWVINSLITDTLTKEFELGAGDLGLLSSISFFAMMAVQLPLGSLLDRYGSRRVQSACLLIAAIGATVFAISSTFPFLVFGRTMMGLGMAITFAAGLKAIVSWFPNDQVAFANGLLVTLGSLGAVTATLPAGLLIDAIGWRVVFLGLAAATTLCAFAVIALVPELPSSRSPSRSPAPGSYRDILADRRFWTLAPLSAACVGTSWALQGLWAAQWLSEVDGYDRATVLRHLFVMAVALSLAATLLGSLVDRLCRRGISLEAQFGAAVLLMIGAELSLILPWSIPSYLSWSVIGMIGSTTTLSHTILPGYFRQEASGRANSALSLMHFSFAFAAQWSIGAIVGLWPMSAGKHPAGAYQIALAATLAMQVASFAWFVWPERWQLGVPRHPKNTRVDLLREKSRRPHSPYRVARLEWLSRLAEADAHLANWRLATIASAGVCCALTILVLMRIGSGLL